MKPEDPREDDDGDRIAARRHDGYVREFVAGDKVEPAARDPRVYVERQPEDAGRAERKAKRGPQPTWVTVDELVAKGRTVVDRVKLLARRVAGRFGHRSDRN